MSGACVIASDEALVRSLTGAADCATQALAAGGYAALANPTGPVAAALTGLLTLYVAFMGYRLLLGRGTLEVSGVSVSAIKIGLVVVLAGNWAMYQQVVCATLFDAPEALARLLSASMQHPGAVLSSDTFVALQQTFDELARDVRSLSGHAGTASPLLGGMPFATMALNADAYGLVFSSVGVLIAARIGLALLLALAPLVAGFLLFEATRGLVEGWLRTMIALALVSLMAMVLLSIELAMLEPLLVTLADERARDALTADSAMKASFVIAIFALLSLGAAIGSLLIARGLRLPRFESRSAAPAYAALSAPPARAAEAALARVAQVAAAADAATRRGGAMRASPAAALQTSIAAADRHRATAASPLVAAGGAAVVHNPRAARPRRELLVSRRKR